MTTVTLAFFAAVLLLAGCTTTPERARAIGAMGDSLGQAGSRIEQSNRDRLMAPQYVPPPPPRY